MTFFLSVIRLIKKTVIVFVLLALTWLALKAFQHFVLGYPNHTNSPTEAAEWLAKKHLPPVLCRKIMPNILFGSQLAEQQAECVYKYAKLTKDPSACELLMPSSYGLSCVGAAMTGYVRPCALGLDRSVTWVNGGKATLSQCMQGYEHACCTVAQARFVVGFDTCDGIEDSEIKDQCKRDLAFKKADPHFCEGIQTPIVKSACEVESSALQENPAICDGCVAPINNLSELK